MRFRGGEFSTGTTGNFQPELTYSRSAALLGVISRRHADVDGAP
jgi:hypothetical protein